MRSHTKRTKRLFELLGHLTRVRFRGNEPARVEWEIQPRNWGCHQSTRTDPQHHSMDVALEQVMELSRVASDCHEGLPASVLGFVSICACGWMEPPLSFIVIALCPSFIHSFIHSYIHSRTPPLLRSRLPFSPDIDKNKRSLRSWRFCPLRVSAGLPFLMSVPNYVGSFRVSLLDFNSFYTFSSTLVSKVLSNITFSLHPPKLVCFLSLSLHCICSPLTRRLLYDSIDGLTLYSSFSCCFFDC